MRPEEVAAWQARLEDTFKGPSGVIGERLLKLQRIEQTLGAQLTSTFVGYLSLMDSFLDFYMESIQLMAGRRKEQWPELARAFRRPTRTRSAIRLRPIPHDTCFPRAVNIQPSPTW
jgi:hypothetical protein